MPRLSKSSLKKPAKKAAFVLKKVPNFERQVSSHWPLSFKQLAAGFVALVLMFQGYSVSSAGPAGLLQVNKVVINDNGGTAVVSDFNLFVKDDSSNTQVASGEFNVFAPGDYMVYENGGPSGYTSSFSGGCDSSGNVTVLDDDSATCTITNNDQPGELIVKKIVVGGLATSSDFTILVYNDIMYASFPGSFAGTATSLDASEYTVTENPQNLYVKSYSGDCSSTGIINIHNGQTSECVITNTFNGGILKVKKIVSSGQADPADFSFSVNGGASLAFNSGGENDLEVAAGNFDVVENPLPQNYSVSYNNCEAVNVAAGQTQTCTITNTFNSEEGGGGPGSEDVTLNVTISNETTDGEGTVIGQGINCDSLIGDSDCQETYASGTPVSLTPTPHDGSSFEGSWTTGPCSGTTSTPCQFNITSNMSVNAHFSLSNSGSAGTPPPSPPPPSGGTNPPPSGNGGAFFGPTSGGSGGGGAGSPAPPEVAGAFTNTPSSGLSMPPGEVLGASTDLPRTGEPAGFIFLLLAGAAAVLNKRLKLV